MLAGRVCFITGSSRGIGNAVAMKLSEHGAEVIIHATDQKKLDAAFEALPRKHNQNHFKVIGDFNTREGVLSVCNQVKQYTAKLDIIIHNAAFFGERNTIENYGVEQFEKVMKINVKAPFMISKELLPLLRKGENASMIFVTSRVGQRGRVPLKTIGAYSVSKFALDGLTWILAEELAEEVPKIRVISVNPGGTRTEMRSVAQPQEDPTALPTAEAISPVFIWLCRKDINIHSEQLFARNWMNLNPESDIQWEKLKADSLL